MKIRLGFVSNSSSSSFVCEVTGEVFEVQDGCYDDAELAKCVNGHFFKKEFLVKWEPEYPGRNTMLASLVEITDSKKQCDVYRKLDLKQLQIEYADHFFRFHKNSYEAHQMKCPICTMTHIKDSDMIAFLLRERKLTRKQAVEAIKSRYVDYESFQKYLKSK